MESPWDLFRRGQLDQERHLRLVREAIGKNLQDLVNHGAITNGGRVRLPIKSLRQWRFEFDPLRQEHTGTFPPDASGGNAVGGQGQQPGRRPRKGDVVGRLPEQGQGGRGDPGGSGEGEGGEGFYEVEVGVEAVAEALFDGLELPRLQRKQAAEYYTEEWQMEDIRRKGSMANLDKRRTALENIVRNAAAGAPGFGNLSDADLRFRAPDVRRVPQDQVAVLFVRDRSGSMGDLEKHLTRVLAFWITRFLTFKYAKAVETAFVLFDTSAQEVTEEEFFHRSEGGGTAVSTGFRLAREIIEERFQPDRYNLYVFAFSDGDNPPSDNKAVDAVVGELAEICNLVGYADIRPSQRAEDHGWSSVAETLRDLDAPHVVTVNISEQEDTLKAMQRFFQK
jgi:uncharacterized protein